ncbi:aldo/keto reductase [Sorangium cellulosum]|uniref:Aldo/keto reductase n=3 Tax=Sorangium cellulosum TaxID=56 RepID=A0A150NYK5_SORCE|nr:aldo/keto reductase [Sorangium cellulosum So0157-2]KYF46952.1 aldo/keto reductase [Sorangium cellulosum]
MTVKRRAGAPPALVVGTMNFGGRTPPEEAERIVGRALERGIAAFDTANLYQDGASERILGRALRGRRDEAQIATKVGLRRVRGKAEGLGRAQVIRAVEESLGRLGTDRVDVCYLHAPDPETPVEETLAAIDALLEQGKILSFGVSNHASWQILEIIARRDAEGKARPAVSQVLYNALIRQLDLEYAAFARRYSVPTAVYNPLAGGLLTGRHAGPDAAQAGSRFEGNRLYQRRYWSARMFELAAGYAAVAADEGMSLLALSYAWLAGREVVDAVLVGPTLAEHLDAAADAIARPLSPEAARRMDALYREHLGTDASYAR